METFVLFFVVFMLLLSLVLCRKIGSLLFDNFLLRQELKEKEKVMFNFSDIFGKFCLFLSSNSSSNLKEIEDFNNSIEVLNSRISSLKGCIDGLIKLSSFGLKKNIEASEQLTNYDTFYESTLEDIEEMVDYLDTLNKKEMISLDPDVQKLTRATKLIREILTGYLNGNKRDKEENR